MSDLFSLFESEHPAEPTRPKRLNDAQRQRVRQLFADLGVGTAPEQLNLVEGVTWSVIYGPACRTDSRAVESQRTSW